MNTSISTGVSIPDEDTKILQAIVQASNLSGARSEVTSRTWQVAVRNDDGLIYRRAGFRNLNQVRRLGMRLKAFGYMDELCGQRDDASGFDAVFSRSVTAHVRHDAEMGLAA